MIISLHVQKGTYRHHAKPLSSGIGLFGGSSLLGSGLLGGSLLDGGLGRLGDTARLGLGEDRLGLLRLWRTVSKTDHEMKRS